jgi:hypothetical protein
VARKLFEAYGDVDRVEGREAYLARLPELRAAGGRLEVTQVLEIDPERAVAMVEIHANRNGRDLHNFAAFLARIPDGRVEELWMVEALPAFSAEFWS